MHLIKHELMSRGYVVGYEKDQRREAALNTALVQQRYAFTHFVTVTFPRATTEQRALETMHRALRALDGLNQKRVRFFYELSIEPKYWTSAVKETASELDTLLTRWHVHVLLGGLGSAITHRQIEQVFRKQCRGLVKVKRNDGSPRLSGYLASRRRGNRIGALQQTNDRTIKATMARLGQVI